MNKKNAIDKYDYLANAASTQDCTGLIPANPSPEQMEVYEDICHYESPRIRAKKE